MCGRILKVGIVMRGNKLPEEYGPCGRELTIKGVRPKEEESLRVKREWRPQYDQSQASQAICALRGESCA